MLVMPPVDVGSGSGLRSMSAGASGAPRTRPFPLRQIKANNTTSFAQRYRLVVENGL